MSISCNCPTHCRGGLSRVLPATRWVVPGALLAMIPKCPMCLAAYVTLVTGIGVSETSAEWLRNGLIVLCIASMLWMAVMVLRGGARVHAAGEAGV